MGKKSKRHAAQAGAAKPAAGSLINNKTVCKVMEELWTRTQGQAPAYLSGLWKEYDAVVALTNSLQEKQGASPSKLPAREEGFPAFYQWLATHRAEFDKVDIGSFGGAGYGVKAKADIEMGERVMRIPERVMMTSETAKTSQLGPLIARDRMLQVMPNVALALHLLNERYNPKSFWKPYIDILPASFSLPLWFDRSQLELLTGSPCLADALQHVRSVGKLYSHLHKLLRAHGDTSIYLYSVGFYYEDFVWAVSAVMSRQNEIPHERDEKQSKLALIPLWDMCNHWLGTISTDFNTELRTCDCFSPSAVREGKELRIFYGARSNAELFLHQGFVYPPNTGDTLRIKLGISSGEDSATKSMKTRLLSRLDIPLSGVFHVLAAEDPFTPQLKAFVRVFTAQPQELQRYERLGRARLKTELLAEKWGEGDTGALQFLIQRCELLLKAYRSTLFEDFERVTQSKLDSKTHQALMLTICERCILGSAAKMAAAQKVLIERGGETNGTATEEEEEGEEGEGEGTTDADGASGGRVGEELPSQLRRVTDCLTGLSAREVGSSDREGQCVGGFEEEGRENGETEEKNELVEGGEVMNGEERREEEVKEELVEGGEVMNGEERREEEVKEELVEGGEVMHGEELREEEVKEELVEGGEVMHGEELREEEVKEELVEGGEVMHGEELREEEVKEELVEGGEVMNGEELREEEVKEELVEGGEVMHGEELREEEVKEELVEGGGEVMNGEELREEEVKEELVEGGEVMNGEELREEEVKEELVEGGEVMNGEELREEEVKEELVEGGEVMNGEELREEEVKEELVEGGEVMNGEELREEEVKEELVEGGEVMNGEELREEEVKEELVEGGEVMNGEELREEEVKEELVEGGGEVMNGEENNEEREEERVVGEIREEDSCGGEDRVTADEPGRRDASEVEEEVERETEDAEAVPTAGGGETDLAENG